MQSIKSFLLFVLASLLATPLIAQKAKVVAPAAVAAPLTAAAPVKEESKPEAKAQATAEFKMLGSIGLAYSEDTYVVTCGGPKVGFSYGWFSFSVGLFPSVLYSNVYKNASAATPVRPNLGAGPEIGFGKVSIIAPIYFMPNNDYRYTFGIAYKF